MSSSHQLPKHPGLGIFLNTTGLFGICIALSVAFYYQLIESELPCPLCLLQRAGLIIIGCGFLSNIRIGIKNRHYCMMIAGCFLTGIIALRQVLLHIKPGDAGYGSNFLGFHFYTWALILSLLTLVAITAMLMVRAGKVSTFQFPLYPRWSKAVMLFFVLLIAANLVSTILECGGGQCPANPTGYLLLPG